MQDGLRGLFGGSKAGWVCDLSGGLNFWGGDGCGGLSQEGIEDGLGTGAGGG